jgi:hypothetical protein
MPLHKRYDRVRLLVDSHFVALARAAHARDPDLDRIEIWHDVFEAALAADKEYEGHPRDDWEEIILQAARKALPATG